MADVKRVLTLDSNVLVAVLRPEERYAEECKKIMEGIPERFILAEPSVVYQEVCGTLARKAGLGVAAEARRQLDSLVHPRFLTNCGRGFSVSAYPLCAQFGIYAIDAMYLKVAIDRRAVLVSLDREEFIERVNAGGPAVEAYHVADFPY
jgi:predicted nucleic acid-binding protein